MTAELSQRQSQGSTDEDFLKLRNLLLGDDYEQVIKQFVVDGETEVVARVLTEALRSRNEQDDSFATELAPVIESSIDASIKNDPKKITNVIFPIIGPAVRKAVASAISDMLQSLNYLLQQSLSVKALIWRFQAWRIKMPYPQYVILRTLKYRVDQIFVIHRETGLLIASVKRADIISEDPDLISSMLAAINEFVRDSFSNSDDSANELNTIQFGDLNLLIESGPLTTTAYAVRGNISAEVKASIVELSERIHRQFLRQLEAFNGDTADFENIGALLQRGLIEDSNQPKRQRPWLAIIGVTIMATLAGWQIWQSWQLNHQIDNDIQWLKKQPGIQLLSYEYSDNTLNIELLRTPTAATTAQLQQEIEKRNYRLVLHSQIAIGQDLTLLIPAIIDTVRLTPATHLSVEKKQLVISGAIEKDKLQQLRTLPIVKQNFSKVTELELTYTPSTDQRTRLQKELVQIATALNNSHLYFQTGTSTLSQGSTLTLTTIIDKLKRVEKIQQQLQPAFLRLSIAGFADKDGNRRVNANLSFERATAVRSMLEKNGITLANIVTFGVGSQKTEILPDAFQRRVDLQLLYQLSKSDKPEANAS